ncbi:SPFH domain-containing protein, partial [Streptomyces sp. PmtG]
MSTTTQRSPESDEGWGQGGAAGAAGRPARLIHSEATTEIPVHLLFRDDPREPVEVALPP